MSDNWLTFIPTSPDYLPGIAAQEEARCLFEAFVPDADEAITGATIKADFFHPSANLERILCPSFRSEISLEWWQVAMSTAYETNYEFLQVTTPVANS